VALHIEKSPSFAIEKPAGAPCPNLDSRHHCRIHNDLDARGFGGCIAYDCLGAGQRVIAEVHDGASWRDNFESLPAISLDFAKMREIHASLQLLHTATQLDLPPHKHTEIAEVMARLCPIEPWTRESFDQFDAPREIAAAQILLLSLKPYLAAAH
jgi:hypothetical protein